MRRIIILFIAALTIQSCEKEQPKPLTKAEVARQVDSIVRQRIIEVENDAKKELEYRMKIEVKIKADSILHEMLTKRDSLHKESSPK